MSLKFLLHSLFCTLSKLENGLRFPCRGARKWVPISGKTIKRGYSRNRHLFHQNWWTRRESNTPRQIGYVQIGAGFLVGETPNSKLLVWILDVGCSFLDFRCCNFLSRKFGFCIRYADRTRWLTRSFPCSVLEADASERRLGPIGKVEQLSTWGIRYLHRTPIHFQVYVSSRQGENMWKRTGAAPQTLLNLWSNPVRCKGLWVESGNFSGWDFGLKTADSFGLAFNKATTLIDTCE